MKISIISVLYNQKLTTGGTWNTLLKPVLSEGKNGCEIHVILAAGRLHSILFF